MFESQARFFAILILAATASCTTSQSVLPINVIWDPDRGYTTHVYTEALSAPSERYVAVELVSKQRRTCDLDLTREYTFLWHRTVVVDRTVFQILVESDSRIGSDHRPINRACKEGDRLMVRAPALVAALDHYRNVTGRDDVPEIKIIPDQVIWNHCPLKTVHCAVSKVFRSQ